MELQDAERKRARLIASCIVFALISIPLILKIVPPNGIYGFRDSVTLSSKAIWYPANAFAGWALLVAAAVSATLLVRLPLTAKRWIVWAAFFGPICAALAASWEYVAQLHGH